MATQISKMIMLSNGMIFSHVPAGEFIMGSNTIGTAQPQHVINIPYDYWIARFPTTRQQYNPATDNLKFAGKENHPAIGISWYSAVDFCKELTQSINNYRYSVINDDNMQSLFIKKVLEIRLPTEAEWEKAARGTDGRQYPWGNKFDKNLCNTEESYFGETTPVGSFSPKGDSPYGCADMSGNVCEWTHSIGEYGYKSIFYPYNPKDGRERGVEESDLMGDNGMAIRNAERVQRGGSFHDGSERVQCAFRIWLNPYRAYKTDGFRVVIAPIDSL